MCGWMRDEVRREEKGCIYVEGEGSGESECCGCVFTVGGVDYSICLCDGERIYVSTVHTEALYGGELDNHRDSPSPCISMSGRKNSIAKMSHQPTSAQSKTTVYR